MALGAPANEKGEVRYDIELAGGDPDGVGNKRPVILGFRPRDAKEPTMKWQIDAIWGDEMWLISEGKMEHFKRISKTPYPATSEKPSKQ